MHVQFLADECNDVAVFLAFVARASELVDKGVSSFKRQDLVINVSGCYVLDVANAYGVLANSGGCLLKESSSETSAHGQNDVYNIIRTLKGPFVDV